MKRERPSGKFIMLYPGTLNQHQGLDVAVRALAIVRKTAPNAEFHIYGEGRTQGSLMETARNLGLQDSVLFHKFMPQKDIARVMANADLAVVPKRADSFGNEAFSTKVFEFMSLGVPVVVSNTKIYRYYFNDSVVKFFQDGDENDLARCILLLMNDEALRAQFVKNASEFIRTYDWDVNKGTYLDVVDSLLDRKPQTRSASVPKTNLGDAA
jgi:glycosyltransferase involved in cell wall biosynthesis